MGQEYFNLGNLPDTNIDYHGINNHGNDRSDEQNGDYLRYSSTAATVDSSDQYKQYTNATPFDYNEVSMMPNTSIHRLCNIPKVQTHGYLMCMLEPWYPQDMTSPSDLASDTSSNYQYNNMMMHSHTESTEYQDPQGVVFPPPALFYSTPEILSNIGSSFAADNTSMQPFQLPPSMTEAPEPMMPATTSMDTTYMPAATVEDMPHQATSYPLAPKATPVERARDRSLAAHQKKIRASRKTKANSLPTPSPTLSTSSVPSSNPSPTTMAPPKSPPSKTRLYCPSCLHSKDYTRGFRGEHELSRHFLQKHSLHRIVWICVDQTPDKKLRNCERCKNRHQYGTSYGGAEHFRRRHTGAFSSEWVEKLRGKNGRRGLNGARLVEEGWLRRVVVRGDGNEVVGAVPEHVAVQQSEQMSRQGVWQTGSIF